MKREGRRRFSKKNDNGKRAIQTKTTAGRFVTPFKTKTTAAQGELLWECGLEEAFNGLLNRLSSWTEIPQQSPVVTEFLRTYTLRTSSREGLEIPGINLYGEYTTHHK